MGKLKAQRVNDIFLDHLECLFKDDEDTEKHVKAQRVNDIFLDHLECLFKDDEDTEKHVKAEGIMFVVGFNPERLQEHRVEIEAMLDELPNEFAESPEGLGVGLS